MSNRRNNQFTWNPHNKATVLDCQFTVDSTNTNGLGVSSVNLSGRVGSVYMHTSATPATGNPNPASGLIVVNLQDNYNKFYGFSPSLIAPLSGSSISSGLTIGQVYVIVGLGSSTLAQWHTAGLRVGIVPAVGVSFIAAAATVVGGGTVQAPATGVSGINHIEMIGNPNLANSNGANVSGAGVGMQLILGCYKTSSALTMNSYTPTGTNANDGPPETFTGDAAVLTGTVASADALGAPVNGTIIGLSFYLNDSAQGV